MRHTDLISVDSMIFVMLSLTRFMLASADKSKIFPLSHLDLRDFARSPWEGFELPADGREKIMNAVCNMFSGVQVEDLLKTASPGESAEVCYASWAAGSGEIVYYTSGSTGVPKAARHTADMLLQEVSEIGKRVDGIMEIVALTPLQLCYGFTAGVLLQKHLGVPLKTLPPLPTLVRESLRPGMLVVGFPDFWNNMSKLTVEAPSGLVCISAGAPWPAEAQDRLRVAGGYSRIVEFFGSSENGVFGCRTVSSDPFELFPYWSRTPLADSSRQFDLQRRLPDGSIVPLPLQDDFDWIDERHFFPVKRRDNAVQVGGVNVFPARIAALLESHPAVKACRVRHMTQNEGARLKAFVVPESAQETSKLRRELDAWCRSRLSTPERPVSFTFGSSLPKTAYGKDCDWKIGE